MKKIFYLFVLVSICLFFVQCEQRGFSTIVDYNQEKESEGKKEDGHFYVDLGLSVCWATCNVGANSPEEYGDYFAWGEVEPKEKYDWSTYKYCNVKDSIIRFSKYCQDSVNYGVDGFCDTLKELEPEDDAAHKKWGGAWRMPTKDKLQELFDKCEWRWVNVNGVNGCLVTGPSGKSIFLPAAGYKYTRGMYNSTHVGSVGYYWSRSLVENKTITAYELSCPFVDEKKKCSTYKRYGGISIRPVIEKNNDN